MRLEPLLGVYSELVRYYLAVSLGAHRSTGKLLSVLASVFTELAQKVLSLVPQPFLLDHVTSAPISLKPQCILDTMFQN